MILRARGLAWIGHQESFDLCKPSKLGIEGSKGKQSLQVGRAKAHREQNSNGLLHESPFGPAFLFWF